MKNTDTNMNHNPIEELRQMTTPVSEQEWAAITSDKRYTQKFGRKGGLIRISFSDGCLKYDDFTCKKL